MADIDPEDLDISVVRPGAVPRGQGGQTTGEYDSYVRVTHKPTGITAERDYNRSQLMNKQSALGEIRHQLAAGWYQDERGWHRKHDMFGGPHDSPPDPDALLNPALLIRDRQVAAMHLTPGNVLRVRGAGHAGRIDLAVAGLSVDPDGTPVLSVAPATAGQSAAREAEARRIGGPVAP
jgi:hypothetical protein